MNKTEIVQRAKSFLSTRSTAYRGVFHPENVYTEVVLKDLAKFCRATKSTYHKDPVLSAMLEGRREVFMRICDHLNLDYEQLWKKYGGNE